MHWQVYIILCSDDSLYTGITTDIQRRFGQHVAGTGAKYFRCCSPCRVVYLEIDHDRSSASRREAQIKKLNAESKRRLIKSSENQIATCTESIEVPFV
jgi:putative endonuclease